MPDINPPTEFLTVASASLSVAGATAAIMIRITGAGGQQTWRYVLADIAGTLGIFYLVFLGLIGVGWSVMLSVSVAGFAAAAGWTAVFGLLQMVAARRVGG